MICGAAGETDRVADEHETGERREGNIGGAYRSRQQACSGTGRRRIVRPRSNAEWCDHYGAERSWGATWIADFFATGERIAGWICGAGGDYQRHTAVSVARNDDRYSAA